MRELELQFDRGMKLITRWICVEAMVSVRSTWWSELSAGWLQNRETAYHGHWITEDTQLLGPER